MVSTRTINICFRGNSELFAYTKDVRQKIKSQEGFTLEEQHFNNLLDSAVFISSSEPSSNRLQEGFIKVVCEPPDFREYMEPILVDSDHEIYTGGTTVSVYRPTLERDIWNVIMGFNA